MPNRLRTVLPVALSSALVLTGAGVMLAFPGEAAPLPTSYSVKTSADLWHINSYDADLSDTTAATARDLSVLQVAGLVDSTTSPRSSGGAYNLAGATAVNQSARRGVVSTATPTADTSVPAAGVAPAGTITDLLSVSSATLGARARWVGDKRCLTTADGLADSTAVGGGASLAPSNIPAGLLASPVVLPTGIATTLPTEATDTPSGLPTTLPTDLPTSGSTTSLPTTLPTELSTDGTTLPTGTPTSGLPLPTLSPLPSVSLTPLPGLPRQAAAAAGGVVLASVNAGTVQTRADLPQQNGTTRDVRGVRAQTIGTVKDTTAPAMTFFGGEVEVRITKEARLTAYADGVHPSVVVWAPPVVTVRLAGQATTYTLPADGTPLAVSYSQNGDVTLTLTAGSLTRTESSAGAVNTGVEASGKASVMHMVVTRHDPLDPSGTGYVALDADFMPMSATAKAPGGGITCPLPDTDGDGLSDALEATIRTNANLRDTDHDGLGDGREYLTFHTNPRRPDTDGDKLEDRPELKRFLTNPRRADTDRDRLNDGVEVRRYRTNPRRKDTDRDGVDDGVEVRRGTDPRHR